MIWQGSPRPSVFAAMVAMTGALGAWAGGIPFQMDVGAPLSGLLFAVDKAPGRVLSVGTTLGDAVYVTLEPILGLGPVQGAGLSSGLYAITSPSTRVGVRGAWYSLEQNDPEREIFVDLQKVFRPGRGPLFFRVGAGLGYGLKGIQHGDLYGDPDAISARDGATFRVNVDVFWRVYARVSAVPVEESALSGSSVREEVEKE